MANGGIRVASVWLFLGGVGGWHLGVNWTLILSFICPKDDLKDGLITEIFEF